MSIEFIRINKFYATYTSYKNALLFLTKCEKITESELSRMNVVEIVDLANIRYTSRMNETKGEFVEDYLKAILE